MARGSGELVREGAEGGVCYQERPEYVPWVREQSTNDDPALSDKETPLTDQDWVGNVTEICYPWIVRCFDPYRFH